jgi:hypothetical protein
VRGKPLGEDVPAGSCAGVSRLGHVVGLPDPGKNWAKQRSTKGAGRGDVVMSLAQLSCGEHVSLMPPLSSKYKIEPMMVGHSA